MGKRNDYGYSCTRTSHHGLMQCCVCNKKITDGRYRHHFKLETDAFVTCHESCCADDPTWAEIDKQAADQEARFAEFRKACGEFRSKWLEFIGDELDNYIEESTHDR